MELLDRYLQAVKFWLPKSQRDDIIAELSEDIQSQIEEKEAELGHKLDESDVEAVLKNLGHPLLIAERYLPSQQYLIGPVLFPVYRLVLKMLLCGYIAPWLLLWIGLLIFDPYRAEHSGLTQIANLRSLWLIMLYSVFLITAAFAFVERFKLKSWLVKGWNPRKLPAVRDPNRISRSDSTFELAGSIVYIALWLNLMSSATVFNIAGGRITLAPATRYFVWAIFFLAIAGIGVCSVNLFRPYWTRLRASVRLAIDSIGWIALCWILKVQPLLEISAPGLSAEEAAKLTAVINGSIMGKVFWFVLATGAVVVFVGIRRVIRVKPRRFRPPHVSLQSSHSQLW
jgi:hypothetical protein